MSPKAPFNPQPSTDQRIVVSVTSCERENGADESQCAQKMELEMSLIRVHSYQVTALNNGYAIPRYICAYTLALPPLWSRPHNLLWWSERVGKWWSCVLALTRARPSVSSARSKGASYLAGSACVCLCACPRVRSEHLPSEACKTGLLAVKKYIVYRNKTCIS